MLSLYARIRLYQAVWRDCLREDLARMPVSTSWVYPGWKIH